MTPIQLAFTLAAFAIAFAWLLRLTRRMNDFEWGDDDSGINMDDLMAAYDGTRDLLSEAFSHIPRNTELWHRVRRELWGDGGGGEGGCGDGFGDGAGDEEETITVMKNCGAKSKLKVIGDG